MWYLQCIEESKRLGLRTYLEQQADKQNSAVAAELHSTPADLSQSDEEEEGDELLQQGGGLTEATSGALHDTLSGLFEMEEEDQDAAGDVRDMSDMCAKPSEATQGVHMAPALLHDIPSGLDGTGGVIDDRQQHSQVDRSKAVPRNTAGTACASSAQHAQHGCLQEAPQVNRSHAHHQGCYEDEEYVLAVTPSGICHKQAWPLATAGAALQAAAAATAAATSASPLATASPVATAFPVASPSATASPVATATAATTSAANTAAASTAAVATRAATASTPLAAAAIPGLPEAIPGSPEAIPGLPAAIPGWSAAIPGLPEAIPGLPAAAGTAATAVVAVLHSDSLIGAITVDGTLADATPTASQGVLHGCATPSPKACPPFTLQHQPAAVHRYSDALHGAQQQLVPEPHLPVCEAEQTLQDQEAAMLHDQEAPMLHDQEAPMLHDQEAPMLKPAHDGEDRQYQQRHLPPEATADEQLCSLVPDTQDLQGEQEAPERTQPWHELWLEKGKQIQEILHQQQQEVVHHAQPKQAGSLRLDPQGLSESPYESAGLQLDTQSVCGSQDESAGLRLDTQCASEGPCKSASLRLDMDSGSDSLYVSACEDDEQAAEQPS